ncbi:MAG: helix-hairpin-helix domain-containing protein, partial [Gammaproteobacteria bacterium]
MLSVRTWLAAASLFASSLATAGPVDINNANAEMLAQELEGIGPARARAIVAYREANGAFTSADQLLEVQGVGPRVLDINRDNIRLE